MGLPGWNWGQLGALPKSEGGPTSRGWAGGRCKGGRSATPGGRQQAAERTLREALDRKQRLLEEAERDNEALQQRIEVGRPQD